jgi:hypothetical protein
MKRSAVLSALVVTIGVLAWNAAGDAAAPTPTPGRRNTVVGQTNTQLSPDQAATPAAGETPTVLVGPVPPASAIDPDVPYTVKEERRLGDYTVRLWGSPSADALSWEDIVTISRPGQADVQIESAFKLSDLTGSDLIGAGHPDLVVQTYSGGAHCCFSWVVYELGPTLTKILESPPSNCEGEFRDLDGDDRLEFVTCDDLFAYKYCCFASSPLPKVIMKYEPGQGYVPAGPQFPEEYADDIARDRQLAIGARAQGQCEWDNSTKCAVLPVVLDYLYSGRQDQAWIELHRLYRFQDEGQFRQEVLDMVTASPLFVSP